MKIIITGASGQLADALITQNPSHELIKLSKTDLDITDAKKIEDILTQIKPDCLINCAAYTHVDKSETEHVQAYKINSYGPELLARECQTHKVKLIHISTDYVFDGAKDTGYIESDSTNPLNIYGRSKLAGEENIRNNCEDHIIIRTSWLYGHKGHNFLRAILAKAKDPNAKTLTVVSDQHGAPTYVPDLADHIYSLVDHKGSGTLHITNTEVCTWFDFARSILRLSNLDENIITPIQTKELNLPATRPRYSYLTSNRLDDFNLKPMRSWQEALTTFFQREGK